MKKLVLSLLLVAGASSVFGQGQVYFANNVTFASQNDHLVYLGSIGAGKELVGSNYRAQLYYGADASSLQAVATTGNNFRAAGTTLPGTWASPGYRTLDNFLPGSTVQLQVKAWDTSTGATWDLATARGASQLFSFTVPAAGSPAGAFYLENMQAFAVVVPEPATFALAGLGIFGFVMMRRRK